MDGLVLALLADPMRYVAYIFAFFGGLGVVLFIMGFSGAIPHVFTYAESAHHMEHARSRAIWGLLIAMVTMGLWEIVRIVSGQAPISYLWLSLILLTPLWFPWVKGLIKKGGGH
jgi:hypothetical protein